MESAGNLTVMDILAGGVDFELAGNGGPDCRDHVPISLRAVEVAVSMVLFALSLLLGQKFDQGRRRDRSGHQGHFMIVNIWKAQNSNLFSSKNDALLIYGKSVTFS